MSHQGRDCTLAHVRVLPDPKDPIPLDKNGKRKSLLLGSQVHARAVAYAIAAENSAKDKGATKEPATGLCFATLICVFKHSFVLQQALPKPLPKTKARRRNQQQVCVLQL